MAKNRKQLLAELRKAVDAFDAESVEAHSRDLERLRRQDDPKSLELISSALNVAIQSDDIDQSLKISKEFIDVIRVNPVQYPTVFVSELKKATQAFDQTRVAELCDKLLNCIRQATHQYSLEDAKKILALLRRKRHFKQIVFIADALILSGKSSANIRRQYAQALLDLGQLAAGLAVLRELEVTCQKDRDEDELAEARGLIGRVHKQYYMDAGTSGVISAPMRRHMKISIDSYNKVYREDRTKLWHAVNTIALAERAKRDRIKLAKPKIDSSKIARSVLHRISRKKPKPDLWDFASAAEACLALGDYRRALNWIVKYTDPREPYADAFEYASTLRQFEEVWQLDAAKPAQAKILQLLRSAVLLKQGGSIQVADLATETTASAKLAEDKSFEKVLGKIRYKSFQWYTTGMDRALGVAQVTDRSGNPQGTGFLLPGPAVHESIRHDWVLVTNAHVISDDPAEQHSDPASLPPDQAVVTFEAGRDAGQEFQVASLVFTSPRSKLDCTIVTLSGTLTFDKPYEIAKRLPPVDKDQRVYVIGHPRGGRLSISLDDNILLDHEVPIVHYRAPTEGGSSGSPVFNQSWDLIALHHVGGMQMRKLNDNQGVYPANEGISFQSILAAVSQELE